MPCVPSTPIPIRAMLRAILAAMLLTAGGETSAQDEAQSPVLEWSQLPRLPDPIGLAGPVAGTSGGALLVGGGANFPDGPPWDGHAKVWHDELFVLPTPDGPWQRGARLPKPLAYSMCASCDDRVLSFGGGDANEHFADGLALRWRAGQLETEPLASMPGPCAFGAAVQLGGYVYVAGGIERPDSTTALHNFWRYDLARDRWDVLEAWPGKPRMLATLGAHGDSVYIFGGTRLYPGDDGAATREYLLDAFAYDTRTRQWREIAAPPRPIVAAPNPAMAIGEHLALLSGDDGSLFHEATTLRDKHPGFPADVHAYNTAADTWSTPGSFPKQTSEARAQWPPVTTHVAPWHGGYVIPSGEARPGVRTSQVMFARPIVHSAKN